LLLIRLLVAAPLIIGPATIVWTDPQSSTSTIQLANLALGTLIAFGFCTPIATLLQAIIQLWMASLGSDLVGFHTENALLGLSLMMLGPGAWSLDAFLFGRRRIDLDNE
jgi:putative oxidoreductase